MFNDDYKKAFGTFVGMDAARRSSKIPMNMETIRKLAEISPAVRRIAPFLLLPPGHIYVRTGSELLPRDERVRYAAEVKGGLFQWNFRSAVEEAGLYRDWRQTRQFYQTLVRELKEAGEAEKISWSGVRASCLPVIHLKDIREALIANLEASITRVVFWNRCAGWETRPDFYPDANHERFERYYKTSCWLPARSMISGWGYVPNGDFISEDTMKLFCGGKPLDYVITRFRRSDINSFLAAKIPAFSPVRSYGFKLSFNLPADQDVMLQLCDPVSQKVIFEGPLSSARAGRMFGPYLGIDQLEKQSIGTNRKEILLGYINSFYQMTSGYAFFGTLALILFLLIRLFQRKTGDVGALWVLGVFYGAALCYLLMISFSAAILYCQSNYHYLKPSFEFVLIGSAFAAAYALTLVQGKMENRKKAA